MWLNSCSIENFGSEILNLLILINQVVCKDPINWILHILEVNIIIIVIARDAVNNFLDGEKNRNKYLSPTEMNCLGTYIVWYTVIPVQVWSYHASIWIGSRLHKYWFKAQTGKQKEDVLITAVS